MNNEKTILITGAALVAIGLIAQKINRRNNTQLAHTSDDMQTDTSITRGYRNNNPLNIIISPENWRGKVSPNTDGKFEQFTSMAYGYRTAFVILRTYVNERGCDTLSKIITRWAPPKENKTSSYIQTVCDITGFKPNTYINPYSETQMTSLVYAMSIAENGREIMPDVQAINQGWQLYIS